MGLFARRKQAGSGGDRGIIDPAAIAALPDVGRKVFSAGQIVDVSHYYLPGFEAAGFPTQGEGWDRFVDQFVEELSIGAAQHGGWGYPGAFHVAKDFVKSEDWSKPALQSLLDEALKVLASQRVDRSMVPFFALARYQEISDERDR